MKKVLCIMLCAALLSLSALPALAAETADTSAQSITLTEGTYIPHEAVVLFQSSAIDTASTPSKGELAAVGADFGEMMDASSAEAEAICAADEETEILKSALGDNFVLEDTLVFDQTPDDSGLAPVGAAGDAPSAHSFSVALVSSETYDTKTLIEKLSRDKRVAKAEPNYIIKPQSYDYSLNDPLNWYNYQVNSPLDTNQDGDNVSNRGVEQERYLSTYAGSLWDRLPKEEDADEIVVAVIDSGINPDHEDLENMLWVNPGDIGLYGVYGFNFYDNKTDVRDKIGHGTHCSGIIGAEANNSLGISGAASMANLKIMMCSTASANEETGDESTSSYRELGAFSYILKAKQRGVNIVATSNSWGSPGYSEVFDTVITRLGEEGVLSFAAAGNDNMDLDYQSHFPSGGNSPYLVSVGAANIDGSRAGFSNYGRSKVDLFAPGVNILSSVGYRVYFPNIYSAEQRSSTTEFYGLFDEHTVISQGAATPSVTDSDETVKPFGASVFRVQDYMGQEVTDSKAFCELSLSSDCVFSKSDRPASLKVTIHRPTPGEQYYLYFPYQKNPQTTGRDNTDFSILLTHAFEDTDVIASIIGGEVLIDQDGSCSLTLGGCPGSVNDEPHRGVATHISGHTIPADTLISADELGDREVGIGLMIQGSAENPSEEDTITLYLDSVAVTKPGAKIPLNSSYDIMSGTSMACPAAAGAYAVLSAVYPKEERQSGSEYALENRARLLSCVRKTDALNDYCTTGGYLDLSLVDENLPALTRVECDLENESLILSGTNLSSDYTLRYRRVINDSDPVSLPSNGMTVEYAEDGKSIVIHHAKALFSTYTEFSLFDGQSVVSKICDFLVKGQKRLERVFHKEYPQTINNTYYLLPRRCMLTDTKGKDLYGYDLGTGVLSKFDGVQFNEYENTDLTEAVLRYYQDEGYDTYEVRHHFTVSLEMLNAPIYTDNRLYHFISVTYAPYEDAYTSTSYLLASMDYTAKTPSWTFTQTNSFEVAFRMQECYSRWFVAEGDRIYCIGNGIRRGSDDFEPFMFALDVHTGIWTEAESLPMQLTSPMLCAKDGKLYAAFGTYFDEENNMLLSTSVYCYDGESWTKTGDIPYIGDRTKVDTRSSIITKGTCAAVKEGLLFFNCPADGGGNVFLYHTDTGVCEPLYISFTDYKADHLSLYSAVETADGVYYFEENGDRVMELFNMYLLRADSGAYTPSFLDEQILGDADQNGKVTVLDSTCIQKYMASIITEDAINRVTADADEDGKVTVLDATAIQKHLAHLPSNEHIGKPIE